jgi:serine/threonine protein kinase
MAKTKKTYRNNKGGKVIASGGYGCVFNPALKCEGASKRELNKISKLMTERHATDEYEEINHIKDKLDTIPNYKDYFLIYDVTLCSPSKLTDSDLSSFNNKCTALPKDDITKKNINLKLDQVMSLNLPNGGLPVDDYIYSNGGYDKLYKTHITLINLFKKGIIPMNRNNIYHSDIKDSNVLIDNSGPELKARLIDWGLTVEYNPGTSTKFPKNWRNRPLQFNVPFSVVIFTDKFYENYSEYLKNGGKVEDSELRPFVINYLNEWLKERGPGHYKFINEIMFLLYSSSLESISDSSKPGVVETEITMPYIIDYIVEVLLHYTKFKEDGSLNLREYLNEVYIQIVDIWGFIMVYYPFLEMFSSNYFNLNENELKIFTQLKFIFNEYLYTPRASPININELLEEFKKFGNLIHIVAYGKRKTKSSKRSLANGIRTHKNIKRKINSTIFKRRKLIKRFKKPFFLSLK